MPPTLPRLLPHNIEAEESLLGAMLLSQQAVQDAVVHVTADDYYRPSHAHVHAAIITVTTRGLTADPVTVADQLRAEGLLEICGGSGALIGFQAGTPTTANAQHYASIIADHAALRRLIGVSTEIVESAYDQPKDITKFIATRLEALATAGQLRKPVKQINPEPVWQLMADPPPRRPYLVDSIARPGELVGFAAGRGIGKSWALMDLARKLADGQGQWLDRFPVNQTDGPIIYCHGEMDSEAAYDRWRKLFGDQFTVPAKLQELYVPWQIRVSKVVEQVGNRRTEYVQAEIDREIAAMFRRERPSAIILDPWRIFFGGTENDNDAQNAALVALLALAGELGCTIFLAHHFKKGDQSGNIDPEDAWRGATVLADRVHCRITVTPHWPTPAKVKTAARKAGIEDRHTQRKWARRHGDMSFLRRVGITPDGMSIKWDETTGEWAQWEDPYGTDDDTDDTPRQRAQPGTVNITNRNHPLRAAFTTAGFFTSSKQFADHLGIDSGTAREMLAAADKAGVIERRGDRWTLTKTSKPKNARASTVVDVDPF
jgi:hypothetical protein